MLKPLVSSSLLLILLCGPALADAPRPVPAVHPLEAAILVTAGGAPRSYSLAMIDDGCGSIQSKIAGKTEDSVHLCVTDGSPMRLEIDWMTRDGQHEIHSKSTVLAKRGATVDVTGDGAKLSVTLK